jgi:hypothetical protein
MDDVEKMEELYEKLNGEFSSTSSKYPIVMAERCQKNIHTILVYLSNLLAIPFFKESKNYTRPYDIVRNFYSLNDFLKFHGFKRDVRMREHIFFTKANIHIKVDIYEIRLDIFRDEDCDDGDDISENFNKIYDLIDYLKDYFNLHNKVAIRE